MTSTPTRVAFGQMLAVGLLAAVAAPAMVGLVVVALMGGPVTLIAGLLVTAALLYGVGTLTRHGSPLTAGAGGRLVWTVLVCVGGTTGAVLGYAALRDLDVDPAASPLIGAALVAVVFALVTGVLTGRRSTGLPAGAVLLALAVTLTVLVDRDTAADDLAERLAVFDTEPDLVFVTAVAGYQAGRPPQPNVAGPFTMTYVKIGDPAREISLWATRGGSRACEAQPPGGFPDDYPVRCRPDGPGRWYVTLPQEHVYLVSRGDRLVRASATLAVERSVLRDAADNARQVPAGELAEVVPAVPEYLRQRVR